MTREKALSPGTVVRNSLGKVGVVASDVCNCCEADQEPVVYDGSHDGFTASNRDSLEIIGEYDSAVADHNKCGQGKGEQCCKYLILMPKGFRCARFSELRNDIIFSSRSAKYSPNNLHPNCYPFPSEEAK